MVRNAKCKDDKWTCKRAKKPNDDVEALYLVKMQEKGDMLTLEEENAAFLEVNPPGPKWSVYGLGNLGCSLASASFQCSFGSTSSSESRLAGEMAALRAENAKIMAENAEMKTTQNTLVSQVETQNWVLKKMLDKVPIGMDPFAEGALFQTGEGSPGTAGSAGMQGSSHAPSGLSGPRS